MLDEPANNRVRGEGGNSFVALNLNSWGVVKRLSQRILIPPFRVRVPAPLPINALAMKRRKITDEELAQVIASSQSMRGAIRSLGLRMAGGTQSHYTRRAKALGLDLTHHLGRRFAHGKPSGRRKPAEEILIKREFGGRAKSLQLRRALIEIGIIEECSICSQGPVWNGKPMTLDVDHINEDWLDDRAENLRFLCPNCHSQFSRNLF